jgi:predicted nucleotide-binding protein (sugar kinase/HSP70/actin superfamily)
LNKHSKLCPYVQSLPYQVGSAFADMLKETRILTAPLHLGQGHRLLKKTFIELGRKLGASTAKVQNAMQEAFDAQIGFEQALKDKGREILASLKTGQKLFVLVSRPYNGCDEGVNLQLPKKLADLGTQVIPMDMLDPDTAQLSDEALHSQIYWSYGQGILRAAEIIRRDRRLYGIYLSNFGCGPDSFLMTFFKDIMTPKPCLQLEIDEHSADAGIITRLEAFLESLKHYRPDEDELRPAEKPAAAATTGASGRTLYIPYMGDGSYGLAACLRAYGQSAEVMPLADESTLLHGRAFTTGKECLPCAITTGDMLKVVKAEDFDSQKAAFFMPGAAGPCRFGMYCSMHRLILKYAGVADVPVIAPNQDSGFYKELTVSFDGSSEQGFMKDAWTALVGPDLLHKVILRLRPFAAEPAEAQAVYDRNLKRWVEAVENRSSLSRLSELMASIADEFAAVKLNEKLSKPKIGVVGEIYVRSHPFANRNIIDRLEELGAVCDLAPLAEWVYYTNFTRSRIAKRAARIRELLTNVVQNYFQHKIEKILAAPLEQRFGRLAEEPVEHVIELARPYLHDSFEGEAILTIGKTIEYHHNGFGGVVNVMPFTCMPSTVVATQTMRVSADCGNMPILNLSFDGQEDATLITRLEAFVEQVAARQKGVFLAADLITAQK